MKQRISDKYCAQCYNMPHRRPRNNHACACGGRYAPEVVPIEMPFRNNDRAEERFATPACVVSRTANGLRFG